MDGEGVYVSDVWTGKKHVSDKWTGKVCVYRINGRERCACVGLMDGEARLFERSEVRLVFGLAQPLPVRNLPDAKAKPSQIKFKLNYTESQRIKMERNRSERGGG